MCQPPGRSTRRKLQDLVGILAGEQADGVPAWQARVSAIHARVRLEGGLPVLALTIEHALVGLRHQDSPSGRPDPEGHERGAHVSHYSGPVDDGRREDGNSPGAKVTGRYFQFAEQSEHAVVDLIADQPNTAPGVHSADRP
jgi:hypothetical protein